VCVEEWGVVVDGGTESVVGISVGILCEAVVVITGSTGRCVLSISPFLVVECRVEACVND